MAASIPQEKNINFAAACNLGAKKASSSLLFFLNNDTVVTENYLDPLLKAYNDPATANKKKIVAPLLLYPANEKGIHTVQHLGIYLEPIFTVGHLYEHFPESHRVVKKKRKLNCITGAAFMVSKENFFAINGFDEAYKNGFEDVDLCLHFNEFFGKDALMEVIPESRIIHHCSMSQGIHDNKVENVNYLASKDIFINAVPDWHELLEENGYELTLTPFLEFVPQLNEKLREKFSSLLVENNLTKLKDQYAKEPYWHEGLKAILSHSQLTAEEKRQLYQEVTIYDLLTMLDKLEFTLPSITSEETRKKFISKLQLVTQENYKAKLAGIAEKNKNLAPKIYDSCVSYLIDYDKFMSTDYKKTKERIENLKKNYL